MNNIQITGNTFRTKDYSIFTRLEGNRAVLASRINKILKSINDAGYIFNPIVVNESYQIIDGQGRFEALKTLGLPIDFVIASGAGLEECIALNSSGTKWSMTDYIDSYCELKKKDYLQLRDLLHEFPDLTTSVKLAIASGTANVPQNIVRNGTFTFSEGQYEQAKNDLQFIASLWPSLKKIHNGPGFYPYAIAFARRCGADDDRLFLTISRASLSPAGSGRQALDAVSDVYNWKLRDQEKRLYLFSLYEKARADKNGWYSSDWVSPASSEEPEV